MAALGTTTKPTILLVPGAWFPQSSYDGFLKVLREAGYPTACASYSSLNPEEPEKADAAADTAFIRRTSLLPLVEAEEKDVVIIMHSYGGIPGSAAATGLGRRPVTRPAAREESLDWSTSPGLWCREAQASRTAREDRCRCG